MKNVIPMFRYSPNEMIEEEVPTSHHNFGYASWLSVKIRFFHKKIGKIQKYCQKYLHS